MILGVDHVALSSDNVDRSLSDLTAKGFTLAFVEKNLPNAPEKKPFLRAYHPAHDLAYCRGERGVAVEITRHGGALGGAGGFYGLVFSGPALTGLRVGCSDAAASRTFWTDGLGFQKSGPLRFSSPVPAWSLDLFLEDARAARDKPFLDDAGSSCVALLCNNIAADLARAGRCGGQTPSPVFSSRVNGRELRIALLRGPSDEIIELIDLGAPHASNR
jgi:catechol 2,3-dioxygenase-like lactoylglutathione lyase family enzyme